MECFEEISSQRITFGLAAVSPATARASKTVTYRIKGFTCITCAVGLDTILHEQRGIIRSKYSYADRTSTIEFDPALITEQQIKAFIEEIGFKAQN